MKVFSMLGLVMISLMISTKAQASFGLSADVGMRTVNPSALNGTSNVDSLQIKSENTYGIDFRYKGRFPFGLRFDNESVSKTATVLGTPAERSINANWVSLIGGYTFLGETTSGWQASLIGQVGLWNSSKVTITDALNNFSGVSAKNSSSLGAHVEVIKAWNHFVLGVQLGFLQRKLKDFETTPNVFINDTSGSRLEVDLSGPITNLILGFRF